MEERMRRVLGCLVVVGLVTLLPAAVRADSEVVDPGAVFPIEPDAKGISVHGTLSILWDQLEDFADCAIANTNMFFVLRLRKGDGPIAGFAGERRGICWEDAAGAIEAVQGFIGSSVIPWFFPDRPDAPFALKSVRRFVEDGETQSAPPFFMLLNIDLRVPRR
jgi:hypothetical protein